MNIITLNILIQLLLKIVVEMCKINNVLPNIVVTPSDSPSVHRILYFPPTKKHFKLKLKKENLPFLNLKIWEILWIPSFGWLTINCKEEWFWAFSPKVVCLKRCSFGRGVSILDPEWKLFWGFETNSATFLIQRKSQTQLLTNFCNALVNSILNLYRHTFDLIFSSILSSSI